MYFKNMVFTSPTGFFKGLVICGLEKVKLAFIDFAFL